jgi:hypothetical protein
VLLLGQQGMSKDDFNSQLAALIALAKQLRVSGFGEQEPEEATKQVLLEPPGLSTVTISAACRRM